MGKISKNSFLLYKDSLAVLDVLTDEQAGKLFKMIKSYQEGNEIDPDPLMAIAFAPFKNYFKRDAESYESQCVQNAENGSKGGRPKKANETEVIPNKPKKPNRLLEKRKKPDSDSDSDSDSDNSTTTNSVSPEKVFSEDSQKFCDWYLKDLAPDTIRKSFNQTMRKKWMETYDFLIRHGYTKEQITGAARWARADEFWNQNFQSPVKLKANNKEGVRYIDVFLEKSRTINGKTAPEVSDFDKKYPKESDVQLPGYKYAPGTGKYHRPAHYNPADHAA